MIRYLLDANAVIALFNRRQSHLAQTVRQHRPDEIGISSIVAHELYYGAFKSQRAEHNVGLVDGLQFEVLEFDREDARQAGLIRAALSAQGQPIGPLDVLIAGQAQSRNLILVTHNIREFSRVSGLNVVDWEILGP